MVKVFISGSRQIKYVPDGARNRIDNMVAGGLDILLGDSEKGVDNLVAEHLYQLQYPNVSIYSIHNSSRIKNLNNAWNFNQVTVPNEPKLEARKLQTFKDRVMADNCDFGLVIWQDTYTNPCFKNTSVSSGSLRNMVQMLLKGTPVTLYHCPEQLNCTTNFSHFQLNSIDELGKVVCGLAPITQKRFELELKEEVQTTAKPASPEPMLSLSKAITATPATCGKLAPMT